MKKTGRMLSLFLVLMVIISLSPIMAFAEGEEHVHSWSEWTVCEYASCGASGLEERYCEDCGEVEEQTVPASGEHDWSSWKTVKKSTVFKNGTKKRTCYECDTVQTKAIKKLKPFVKFKKKTYKIKVGKTLSLKARVKFARGDKAKKWKSSNKKIATVSSKGKIKAKKTGKGKITVKMKSGTSNCRTLSRSKNIRSGSLSSCPKSRRCKVCF